MITVKPTKEMIDAAKKLHTGRLIFVYKDGNTIRAETENGLDPYVWRNGQWRAMRCV